MQKKNTIIDESKQNFWMYEHGTKYTLVKMQKLKFTIAQMIDIMTCLQIKLYISRTQKKQKIVTRKHMISYQKRVGKNNTWTAEKKRIWIEHILRMDNVILLKKLQTKEIGKRL